MCKERSDFQESLEGGKVAAITDGDDRDRTPTLPVAKSSLIDGGTGGGEVAQRQGAEESGARRSERTTSRATNGSGHDEGGHGGHDDVLPTREREPTRSGDDPDLCGNCPEPMIPGRMYCSVCGWKRGSDRRGSGESSGCSSSEYSDSRASDVGQSSGRGSGNNERPRPKCRKCLKVIKLTDKYCKSCGCSCADPKARVIIDPVGEDIETKEK